MDRTDPLTQRHSSTMPRIELDFQKKDNLSVGQRRSNINSTEFSDEELQQIERRMHLVRRA